VVLDAGSATFAAEAAPNIEAVLVQNLAGNVLWTRRMDRFTLQVLADFRPVSKAKGPASKPFAAIGRELPTIKVWLLGKEGAAIPAIQQWQTPTAGAKLPDTRQKSGEVLYAYPLSEGAGAIAAVICTDGDCIVRKIAPFPQ
jgi:hypothetical protein